MKRRQSAEAIQYTLRNVPRALDRVLRREAARQAKSLNEVALDALARGVGIEREAREQHDLDFLIGTWTDDAAVDQALAEQRTIDGDLWR
jgi:hypothetical protein